MNIIKQSKYFFALSAIFIVAGLLALFIWGLKLGIDFSGGTLWEIKFEEKASVNSQEIESFLKSNQAEISRTSSTSENSVLIRMKEADEIKINQLKENLSTNYGQVSDLRLETVGPTISKELTKNALFALSLAFGAIVLYVTWAFRSVPKPTSSLSFGVFTITAVFHDLIIVTGAFAILGKLFAIEVDSLFITALLTIIGFSVHDTIVVFDRVRENLKKYKEHSFEEIANHSILQTIARSLNTSLTAIFVLTALFIFGGETIKTFVLALLIGIIVGTYSSIFNATPLLVVWNKYKNKV